jgi:hypothetical protein
MPDNSTDDLEDLEPTADDADEVKGGFLAKGEHIKDPKITP